MDARQQKRVRSFLKRQHAELIDVKRKHIVNGVKAARQHRAALANKLNDWSSDGKLQSENEQAAKRWAAYTAAALANSTRNAISDASAEAADLAGEHAAQFSDLAGDLFGADAFELDDVEYEEDDARLDRLEASYFGNGRRGVYASLLKVASAVAAGMTLSEFAASFKEESEDPEELAVFVFGSVETRTEMYIRTEAGNAYSEQMSDIASADTTLKKRWATIDPGCEEICHPTDGQVRDMDDYFDMGDDSAVDFPPAHPNCDCTWVYWKDEFGSMKSTDDMVDEDMAA